MYKKFNVGCSVKISVLFLVLSKLQYIYLFVKCLLIIILNVIMWNWVISVTKMWYLCNVKICQTKVVYSLCLKTKNKNQKHCLSICLPLHHKDDFEMFQYKCLNVNFTNVFQVQISVLQISYSIRKTKTI